MKVGIIGNYGHDNNGDEAILLGILAQLETTAGIQREDIVVFSNHPEKTKERCQVKAVPLLHKRGGMFSSGLATLKAAKKIMRELDTVIVGGGGLLMDMYKRDAPLYSTLGTTAKKSGCRLVIHAVGAGPVTTAPGKFFIKRLVNAADSVSVRDQPSQQLLKDLSGRTDIEVVSDPAFAISAHTRRNPSKSIQKVAMTAAPYFSRQYWPVHDEEKYQTYIQGMAKAADQLIERNEVALTFFSTKYPEDIEVSRDIHNAMKRKAQAELLTDHLHPEDIVAFAAAQDLIIGTRLHSLILAVAAETPVIGVEYHHKVRHFMQVIEGSALSQPIKDLDEGLIQKFERLSADWAETQRRFADTSTALRNESLHTLDRLDWLRK